MTSIARAGQPPATTVRDTKGLKRSLQVVAAAGLLFGAGEFVLGLAVASLTLCLVGVLSATFGLWLARECSRLQVGGEARVVGRLASVILVMLPVGVLMLPGVAGSLAVVAVIPAVLAIPFVSRPVLARVMLLGAASGVACPIVGRVAEHATLADPAFLLAVVALCAAYGLVFGFMWTVSGRLKDAAADLGSVVMMSRDLARTLDPMVVGDAIASHIARAVGADECGLNYLDQDGDSLLVHGYFPAERRPFIEPSYTASDYPATRRVIDEQVAYSASIDDPTADRSEVAFLTSIGRGSLAIVPLVAAGRTVGVLEFSSERSGAFDERQLDLASMLAREAAMALENARLYGQVHHQAFHDALTGLPGRILFRDRVGEAIRQAERSGGSVTAVLYIDLNDFKLLNDRLGHAHGDDLLVAVANRLRTSIRTGDTAARLGGDEFAVLLPELVDAREAEDVADRLLAAFRVPFSVAGVSATIGASIGLDVTDDRGAGADDLLRNADVAMYAAKARGRDGWIRFDPTLREAAAARAQLARMLEGADERDELRLDYQPIIDLDTGRITALEALLRWQPTGRPLLMPATFVGVAEETGAILAMGRWVLREACRNLRDWQTRFEMPDLQISVNLTASQFDDAAVVSWVREALAETGVTPSSLTLEITESGLMDNTPQTVERLTELRELGIRVAIDDFGTGYSSLSYLERFPVDILKIDRSFVSGHHGDGRRSVLAPAIVDLARRLDLAVVAEGIETEEQADWLRSIGCRYGQGYLFARPLGPAAVEMALSASGALPVSSSSFASPDVRDQRRRPAGRAGRRPRKDRGPALRLVSGA